MTKKQMEMDKSDGFYDKEIIRLSNEVALDIAMVDEYKREFAESIKNLDRNEIISASEMAPLRIRKPFKVRVREFWVRLVNTLS